LRTSARRFTNRVIRFAQNQPCKYNTLKYTWLLALACVVLVAVRLPHLNRPLSKHHEYNTAVVLINAESWQQAGGASRFFFTPLMNYQGAGNRVLENGPHVDALQNHVYLSFGAGWYVLPYLAFKLFHVPPSPLALQVLNLCISLLTLWLLFGLLNATTRSPAAAFGGAVVFAFLPGPLWYGGNGYVTTIIMLPLVLLLLRLWHRFAQGHQNIGPGSLLALALVAVVLTYIDWITPFLCAGMGLWSVAQLRRSRRYAWVLLAAAIGTVVGIGLVLAQFAQYLGWPQVLDYWTQRFTDRSGTAVQGLSRAAMLGLLAKNLAAAVLPLLICLWPLASKAGRAGLKTALWLYWAMGAVLVYNLVFFNWSVEHEFAWMAFALVATIMVAVQMVAGIAPRAKWASIGACVVLSLGMYYGINRPGAISQSGARYDAQQVLGTQIGTAMPPDAVLFTNDDFNKVLEYYARRTFNHCATPAEARQVMVKYGVKSAFWLQIENNKWLRTDTLQLPLP
jgi:MFS family permease